jgi:hypothetical protein
VFSVFALMQNFYQSKGHNLAKTPNQSGKIQNLRISLYRYVHVSEESRQIAAKSYFGRVWSKNSLAWLEMTRKKLENQCAVISEATEGERKFFLKIFEQKKKNLKKF